MWWISTETTQSTLRQFGAQKTLTDAKQANYVGFLHRHPFVTDAYELGFAPGVRADYTYQLERWSNVDLPVCILDNDFHNPDFDRYLERYEQYEPQVAIIGDVYSAEEAVQLNETADMLVSKWPGHEIVVVPKHRAAFKQLDDDLVLGYAMGYSDIHATDFSDPIEWRGRRVHLLGASPHRQYDVIEELTQPTLSNDLPADIVGLDWNGVQKVAYLGEYWTPDGWQRADHLSIRDTVWKSLQEIKRFWQDHGVWPDTEPVDRYGPAVCEPDEPLYAVNATDITSREQLEAAVVAEYEEYGALAFQTETERAWFEYSEGLSEFWEP